MESGYPETTPQRVTFLDAHRMYDVEEDELMSWRLEGDAWDEAPPAEDGGEGPTFTLDMVDIEIRQMER